jgi:SAM-dependent methyltransferase
MLGDDQYCTPGWWHHMLYFIGHNTSLNWGMLGWSVIFAEDLVRVGFLPNKESFYRDSQRLQQLTVHNLPREAISGVWCNWDKPRYRGCCSGTAFVIRKSLWFQFEGFYEKIFQFDEDYGDNVWNLTDKTCIQIPTPPILHYGGACCWPPECGAGDVKWREAWKTRPFVPVDFEDRGKVAATTIIKGQPEHVAFLPLPFTQPTTGLILDLGCGKNVRNPGAIGVDLVGPPITDAEVTCNLGFDPLPFLDGSCKLVVAHDILEHIPHTIWLSVAGNIKRLTPTIQLFNEVWRVLEDGGLFETAIPIYPNGEAFQDPTHASVWTADSFNYFSNTYHGFKEAYGHTSNFKVVKQFVDGAHLHTLLQAVK